MDFREGFADHGNGHVPVAISVTISGLWLHLCLCV